jgi:hypothetical protein
LPQKILTEKKKQGTLNQVEKQNILQNFTPKPTIPLQSNSNKILITDSAKKKLWSEKKPKPPPTSSIKKKVRFDLNSNTANEISSTIHLTQNEEVSVHNIKPAHEILVSLTFYLFLYSPICKEVFLFS